MKSIKQQLDTFNSIGSLNLNQFQLMMLKDMLLGFSLLRTKEEYIGLQRYLNASLLQYYLLV